VNARIRSAVEYYRANGLASFVAQSFKSILGMSRGKQYRRFVRRLDGRDHASVFSEIYAKNFWKGGRSRSGAGSEAAYTENLRFFLPIIFDRFAIRTIVDAPCGDFNWMRLVPLTKGMSYLGIDIVPELIARNRKAFGSARHRFAVADIVADPLPTADILICRDCLFHLGNKDVVLLLKNFVDSKTSFLLTSTHINQGGETVNTDIDAGDFRLIDLFSDPFCLPRDVRYRVEDFAPPHPPREMCLWDRAQISAALHEMTGKMASF
jgi:hypothetical protein